MSYGLSNQVQMDS